jgi:hypothetical protein
MLISSTLNNKRGEIKMKYKKLIAAATFVASVSAFLSLGSGTAFAATKTWVGAGSDNNFSTAANWSPSGAPANGDDLVFDTGTTVTRSDASNDISNLSVKSVTFTGSGIGGVTNFEATSPLTITDAMDEEAGVTAVTYIEGSVILGGDVVVRGVGFGYSTQSGTVDLNGNTLTFAGNPNNDILALANPITGNGTVIYDGGDNSGVQLYAANTYTGSTIYRSGDILSVGLHPNDVFGTSAITIDAFASLSLSIPASANNTTWNNQVTIAPTNQSEWYDDFASIFFSRQGSGETINLNVPNIILQSNTRLGANEVNVNLAGIQSNGHCIEYLNYSTVTGNWSDGTFTNGPAFCEVAAVNATTKAKAPNTGFGILTRNPLATLAITSVAAIVLAVIAKKYRPLASRR